MNDNCITRFEVSNFKKFDHLVVENIGQVNLITGDNNVGKTTLLEALLFSEDNLRWISYLHQTLFYRGIYISPEKINTDEIEFPSENFLTYILKNINKKLICNFTSATGETNEVAIEHKSIDTLQESDLKFRKDKYKIANVKDWVAFYKNGKLNELQWLYYDDKEVKKPTYWPYIGIDTSYGNDLHRYEQIVSSKTANNNLSPEFDFSDKKKIITFLNVMINDIVDYDFLPFGKNRIHAIARSIDNKYRPLTTFGDGFQKYFRYVLTILFATKINDPRIMIDEIDTGVHYLKMKDEWRTIFELSQQTGIQIFATTHSLDCIKAFVEAAEENEEIRNDLRLIEIEEFTAKDGATKHTATTFNHETLKYKIEMNTNVLGGDVWR